VFLGWDFSRRMRFVVLLHLKKARTSGPFSWLGGLFQARQIS